MGAFETIFENFKAEKSKYFILLRHSKSSTSAISNVFNGYESCKDNLIYLISEKVFAAIDKSALPDEAKFLPISFKQFSEIIDKSPENSSLKIIENEQLEVIIMSGDVKKYCQLQERKEKNNIIFFFLFAIMLICVLALKGLYFYVSYLFIFKILEMSGMFASIANILLFIVLNMISDKLCDNLIKDLKIKEA